MMKEKSIERNGEKVTEVRSDAGKLLYIKTPRGYELKCPRSKEICLIKYEEMVSDCLGCLREDSGGGKNKIKDILKSLEDSE